MSLFVPLFPCSEVSKERFGLALAKDGSVSDHGSDQVGVNVGGGTSIFDVALAVVVSSLGGNSERGSSVSDTIGELSETGGLVDTSKTLLVVLAIGLHVDFVLLFELGHHVVDVFESASALSHGLGGIIGVAS